MTVTQAISLSRTGVIYRKPYQIEVGKQLQNSKIARDVWPAIFVTVGRSGIPRHIYLRDSL
jgi:hypothetical protein